MSEIMHANLSAAESAAPTTTTQTLSPRASLPKLTAIEVMALDRLNRAAVDDVRRGIRDHYELAHETGRRFTTTHARKLEALGLVEDMSRARGTLFRLRITEAGRAFVRGEG